MHTVRYLMLVSAVCAASPLARAGEVSCEVTLEAQGTYYDPAGMISSVNPVARGGWIVKGLILGAKGASGASNFYEGRGALTASWSASLKAIEGTLPKGVPNPRNFTTANNMGEGQASAQKVASGYAQQSGCQKTKIKVTQAAPVAQAPYAWPSPFLALLLSAPAAAEPQEAEKLELVSLRDSRSGFEHGTQELTRALEQLSGDGCIASPGVASYLSSAVEESKSVQGFVARHLDHLEALVAKPMTMEGPAACSGSFSSLVRELEKRQSEVSGTRRNLGQAAQHAFRLVSSLYDIDQYEVRDRACASRAFNGFRTSARQALASLGSFAQFEDTLTRDEAELTTLVASNRVRLAACAGNEGLPAPLTATVSSAPAAAPARVPAGKAGNQGSDITGIRENAAKDRP